MRLHPIFGSAFLDGFSMAGAFTKLRLPGAPERLFAAPAAPDTCDISLEEFQQRIHQVFLEVAHASGSAPDAREIYLEDIDRLARQLWLAREESAHDRRPSRAS